MKLWVVIAVIVILGAVLGGFHEWGYLRPCPDHAEGLTPHMLPELANMTDEQRDSLRVEWIDWEGERVRAARWSVDPFQIRWAPLENTPLGCRATDERQNLLQQAPAPLPRPSGSVPVSRSPVLYLNEYANIHAEYTIIMEREA